MISRLRSAQALPRLDDDDDENDGDDELDFANGDESKTSSSPTLVLPSPGDPPPSSLGLLVLCPNAALCDQVVSVCNDVFARGGLKLTAARVGGGSGGGGFTSSSHHDHHRQQLPYPPPDITAATPAGLLGATHAAGGGASWSPAAVISRTRAVVLDEADALLGGGYARDSCRVLEGMRAADEGVRLASAREWLEAEKKKNSLLPAWRELPQKARRAARDGGATVLASELKSSSPASISFSAPPPDLPRRQYVFAAATMPEDPRMTDSDFGVAGEGGGRGKKRRDSRRPSNSAPAGALLRRDFPEARWVGGFALHRPISSVEHVWIDLVDEEEGEIVEGTERGPRWARALVEAVSSSSSSCSSSSSSPSKATTATTTLVFARTAGAAAEVCAKLRASGIDALEYSSSVSLADRKRALAALRRGATTEGDDAHGVDGVDGDATKNVVVVVATDAAARGLDLGPSSSGVDHVVQADFAANAVDWLHRVGRTGRGPSSGEGKGNARGRVTSLVTRGDAALADAIRGALEAGQPVDGSFSRNRSFRNKLRKYGEFVPRGEVYRGGTGGRGGG